MLPMNATYSCPFHDAENAATFSTRFPPRNREKRNKEREAGKHREYGMNEASGTGSRRNKTSIPLTPANRPLMNKGSSSQKQQEQYGKTDTTLSRNRKPLPALPASFRISGIPVSARRTWADLGNGPGRTGKPAEKKWTSRAPAAPPSIPAGASFPYRPERP